MAGIAIVLDLLKKSQTKHSLHSSSFSSASTVASAAAVSAPFASRFLFGSFQPRVAYCDAAAGIDDEYLATIRKMSVDVLQHEPFAYIPSSKPKTVSDDDADFLDNTPEEPRPDLIAPLKKSVKQIARETTVVTTRRLLERLALSYVSQRMAWKLLKDVPQSALRKAERGWPTHVYIFKVSQTTLRGHFLGVAASWAVQVGIEVYRCVFRYVKPEGDEEEQVKISEQYKDLGNKVVGITIRCGASLVFAAIGAGICSCLIRPSSGQWIGCALGDLAGPIVVSACLQKTLQANI